MAPNPRITTFALGLSIAVVVLTIFSAGTANARSLRPPELPEDAWEEETDGLSGPASEAEWKDGPQRSLENRSPVQERSETDEAESAKVGICLIGVESTCNGDTWEEDRGTDSDVFSHDETVSAASNSPEFTVGLEMTNQSHGNELNSTADDSLKTTLEWEESAVEKTDSGNQTG